MEIKKQKFAAAATLKLSNLKLLSLCILFCYLVTKTKFGLAANNFTDALAKQEVEQLMTQQRLGKTLRNLSLFGITKRLKGYRNISNGRFEIAQAIVFYYYK